MVRAFVEISPFFYSCLFVCVFVLDIRSKLKSASSKLNTIFVTFSDEDENRRESIEVRRVRSTQFEKSPKVSKTVPLIKRKEIVGEWQRREKGKSTGPRPFSRSLHSDNTTIQPKWRRTLSACSAGEGRGSRIQEMSGEERYSV